MDIHFTIKNLYSNGDYNKLIELFSRYKTFDYTEWDYFYFINSLYKLKDYELCLTIFRDEYRKKFPQSKLVYTTIGWALYKCRIKQFEFSQNDSRLFFKQVNYILDILTNIHDSNSCLLRWKVVESTIDYLGTKTKTPYTTWLTNQYLNKISPNNLSKDTSVFNLKNGRVIEVASLHETWYSEKSKCLIELKSFEECIRICDEALIMVNKFHYNNDSWFKYRKAQSLLALGYLSDAKELIQNILKTGFKHWCLYNVLFQIACKEEDKEFALKNAGLCALSDSSHEMRILFYSVFGEYLSFIGEKRLAQLHFQFIDLIKREKKWKLRKKNILPIDEQILSMSKEDVLKELVLFWQNIRTIGVKYYTGEIIKILSNGKSGFILNNETHQKHYFSIKDILGKKIFREKDKVTFTIIERIDHKKGVPSLCATNISVKSTL